MFGRGGGGGVSNTTHRIIPDNAPRVFLIQKKKLVCPVVSKICTAPTDGGNRWRLELN